jgi:hypothetical protein
MDPLCPPMLRCRNMLLCQDGPFGRRRILRKPDRKILMSGFKESHKANKFN